MKNLSTDSSISESTATEVIFDACRDNEHLDRVSVKNRRGEFVVTFKLNADGTHEATIRDYEGVVVAFATVDEFDR